MFFYFLFIDLGNNSESIHESIHSFFPFNNKLRVDINKQSYKQISIHPPIWVFDWPMLIPIFIKHYGTRGQYNTIAKNTEFGETKSTIIVYYMASN